MKYLQRQQFSFTKTSIEIKVSPENPESCKVQFFFFKVNSLAEYLFYKPAFQYLLFFEMNSRQGNRSKLSFYQQNYN